MATRNCLVLGAAGFLGRAMEHRLKEEGAYVVSVARKMPTWPSVADKWVICDLTNVPEFHHHFHHYTFDEVYQFASDGGGVGYIANSDNDASIMTNSLKINLYTLEAIVRTGHANKIFFASSQCVYPAIPPIDPFASERLVFPVMHQFRETDASFNNFPFAQEKLFSEALYDAYRRNHGLTVRIGRLGNTYGPFCRLDDDRAKAPAAICRKVAEAPYAGSIRLWGDGTQIRTFTYVDDAIEGIRRLMDVDYQYPVNISSREAVTISELLDAVCHASGKIIGFEPEDRPTGVRARSSDNSLALEVLGWEPTTPLAEGICKLYTWVSQQVLNQKVA